MLIYLYVFLLPIVGASNGSYNVGAEQHNAPCEDCNSIIERMEFYNLPDFEKGAWEEAWNLYYGSHWELKVRFSDGIEGKLFKGGNTGQFFVGDYTGGKYYYLNQRSGIRALYIYKKYECVSAKYRK